MSFTLGTLAFLFIIAIMAGWVDTVAGGGGLLTFPSLVLAGMPPAVAIATNKLQGSAGTFTATMFFKKKKIINLKKMRFTIAMTFLGTVLGSWVILQMRSDYLIMALPLLLILVACYFLFSKKVSNDDRPARISEKTFTCFFPPLLGFYDGFFGPGTGSFIAWAFIEFRGYGASKATAHAKVLNFTSNITALFYFMLFGKIAWFIGAVMIAGQLIGAFFGAHTVFHKGVSVIRPVIVIVCFSMALRILWQNF